MGFLGLNLANLLEAESLARAATAGSGTAPAKPIKSCILMFYYGGPSHHDTWDMKPNAPAEVRGEFGQIATSVPGIRISEHLPRSARVMDRLAVIRSAAPQDDQPQRSRRRSAVRPHSAPRRPGVAVQRPHDRLSLFRLSPDVPKGAAANVPSHVVLPHVMFNVVKLPGQTAGFLGPAFEPLQVTKDPNAPDFRVGEIELPAGLSVGELENRRALLARINSQMAGESAATGSIGAYYNRAFDLLRSDAVPQELRHRQRRPQAARARAQHSWAKRLLARRLVENGVRFVSVYDKVHNGLDNWDTHINNFGRLKDSLLPPCDMAFSAG